MITIYTLEDSQKWETIVRSFKRFDVYYLPGYVRAFELNGDGKAILLYFENGNTKAVNVVMKRDIANCAALKGKIEEDYWFDFTTPYGYGGWLVEGDDYQALQQEYESFAERQHIVSEFVRFHPMLQNWVGLGEIYNETLLGKTIFMDTSSEEKIWSNFTSQNRGKVRKAIKNGLEVFWCRDERILDSFIDIYNETMNKDSATDYYYFNKDFFKSIMNDLKYNAMWFYAMKDGEIAAAAVFLFCNGQMHYHLSGSRRKYQSIAPVNLLLYEAALWASMNGYQTLHMGGGVGAKEDSLFVFKKSFNRNEEAEFHIGKRVFNTKKYQELVNLRCVEEPGHPESGYFPKYRA